MAEMKTEDENRLMKKAPLSLACLTLPNLCLLYLSPAYIDLGSVVKEDDTVCLIEVMKVFTAVKAGVRGRIKEILVETNDMVEYGQPLFMVEPETDLV